MFSQEIIVVGEPVEKELAYRGRLGKDPATLYTLVKEDKTVERGGLFGHHYNSLELEDKVEMHLKNEVMVIEKEFVKGGFERECGFNQKEWKEIINYKVLEKKVPSQ